MDRFSSVMEYVLGVLMMYGGVNTALQPVVTTGNIFAVILGGAISTYTFAVVIFILGAMLVAGKVLKRNKLRSCVLFLIYLLMFYATFADIVVAGILALTWLDSVIFAIWSSWLHGRLNVREGATLKGAVKKWKTGNQRVAAPTP